MSDLEGALLGLLLTCHILFLLSLSCVAYQFPPRYWMYLLSNRAAPLLAVLLCFDILNFGETRTALQSLLFGLSHVEMMLVVWVLNTRPDRNPVLFCAVFAYLVLIIQTVTVYGQLRSVDAVDTNSRVANHALFSFNQLIYLFSIMVYLLQKVAGPEDDVLFTPKGSVAALSGSQPPAPLVSNVPLLDSLLRCVCCSFCTYPSASRSNTAAAADSASAAHYSLQIDHH